MRLNSKNIARLALLTSIALIAFIIESFFPPLFIPGAKVGVSNIITMLVLYGFGTAEAFVVLIIKIIIGSFFGNASTLLYSMSAGVLSLAVCALLRSFFKDRISILCVSVVGAVIHNLTQCVMYAIVTQTREVLAYALPLTALGILSGAVVGATATILLNSNIGVFKPLP
ncbi:MAG: Gx transporter family protein [Clostridia bacterium]|nr:Gx transporter family protein [Clostridia bacterium]